MAKSLFLIIISSLISLTTSAQFLASADKVDLVGLDNSGVAETVLEPEPEPTPAVAKAPAAGVATAKTAAKAQTSAAAPAAPAMPNFTVSIYSGEMIAHGLSYSSIYKTGMLVYGHNTGNLMGGLFRLGAGSEFTITEGGVARTYRVASVVTYQKTADGYLNGDPYLMGDIVDTAMGHSVALMTCSGTSYGNGDASHRLVVYADAV